MLSVNLKLPIDLIGYDTLHQILTKSCFACYKFDVALP